MSPSALGSFTATTLVQASGICEGRDGRQEAPQEGRPAARRERPQSTPRTTTSSTPTLGHSRQSLERASIPILSKLMAVPRWLIVVLMGAFLFLGLIQTGSLSWLGGIFLLIVGGFLGWLLALSWPVLTPGRRATRLIIVVAVLGLAVLKFLGRF